MKIKQLVPILLCLSLVTTLMAQPSNDPCTAPIMLEADLGTVCQTIGEGTNIDAIDVPDIPIPNCWTTAGNRDVWYSFRAPASTMTITLTGNTVVNPGGSLEAPQIALYSQPCSGADIACNSDEFMTNSQDVTATDLVLGQEYYIRVAGRDGREGTFQLCLTAFNFTPPPQADCQEAVILCDQSSFTVENLVGTGLEPNELAGLNTCLPSELASSWYTFECGQSGTLTFTLTPNNPEDDLDFIVFELPNGIDDCANKTPIRCMASGANINEALDDFIRCTGPTGLRVGETDVTEAAGCVNPADNNFLAPINMVQGQAYVLLVMNFSPSGQGFSIDFGGTGSFAGPSASIEVIDGQTLEEIECDKTFTLDALVDFDQGTIVSYEWRFGVDATPQTAAGSMPQEVTYASIGEKIVSLTLTTDEGCVITEILEIDVQPCCADISDLDISLDMVANLRCYEDNSGQITLGGQGGTPPYEYSVNGEDWQFTNTLSPLPAGTYQVFLRDRKGCRDSIGVELTQPDELRVDAGPDREVGLGCMVDITAVATAVGLPHTYAWRSTDTTFMDPRMPNFTTIPRGPSMYVVTVTNDAGCTAMDTLVITTDDERPLYIPNAFSPNNDGINDQFIVFGGKAVDMITSLDIYDRWGNRLFQRTNIPINQTFFGWDGTRDGEVLNPGLYVYVAQVRFLDGIIQTFHGDINLMK